MRFFKLILFALFLGTQANAQEPAVGEIRLVSFNHAPKGWALCNGQLLPINQNQALFSLIGTTYGGDGRVNFALPDLRGRSLMGVGAGHSLGEKGGEATHTLTISEMPQHVHVVTGSITLPISSSNATLTAPTNNYFAVQLQKHYADVPTTSTTGCEFAHSLTANNTGGSQAHNNMQPYLVMNYIIALQGYYPSQN